MIFPEYVQSSSQLAGVNPAVAVGELKWANRNMGPCHTLKTPLIVSCLRTFTHSHTQTNWGGYPEIIGTYEVPKWLPKFQILSTISLVDRFAT